MYIAMVNRPDDPVSLLIYVKNMVAQLSALGAEVVPFLESEPIPHNCDLVWDPGLCMRRIAPVLRTASIPVVGTIHGVKAFSLPLEELVNNNAEKLELAKLQDDLIEDWKWFGDKAEAIVAVSQYCANEVIRAFDVPKAKVQAIYNGVDTSIFHEEVQQSELDRPYFLVISSVNPIKNFKRILAAYLGLNPDIRPDLVAIIPDYSDELSCDRVRIIREELKQQELARLYKGALALVFTSLRETFGMPILEAMSCGCPVITSDDTGCAEVAGDAALRVDPRSIDQIGAAMQRVIDDELLREELRVKGRERVRGFSWRDSAEQLLQVMQSTLPLERKRTPILRKIEVTTTAGCDVACKFCPQKAFHNGYIRTGAVKTFEWENYVTILDKIPTRVGISFGGMSEPFQHPQCTDMILLAHERGHIVEIFTTLYGLSYENLQKLISNLKIGCSSTDDRLYLHLPSVGNIEKIPINDNYLRMLKLLLDSKLDIEFHYHGERLHEALNVLSFGEKVSYWKIHDRAENETSFYKKQERKLGKISCIMNFEVNVLLPNGDLLICSQDFGARHVIGNLMSDRPEEIYQSTEFKRIQKATADDTTDIMCRYCHFSVVEKE
jgi:radical SAM protein with 4Fe4S-binding SPASM domain